MKYRKTVLIDAEQFDGSEQMMEKYEIRQGINPIFQPSSCYFIKALEGETAFYIGDWIATGIDGEHWPIADDIFKRTYEPVEENNEN